MSKVKASSDPNKPTYEQIMLDNIEQIVKKLRELEGAERKYWVLIIQELRDDLMNYQGRTQWLKFLLYNRPQPEERRRTFRISTNADFNSILDEFFKGLGMFK